MSPHERVITTSQDSLSRRAGGPHAGSEQYDHPCIQNTMNAIVPPAFRWKVDPDVTLYEGDKHKDSVGHSVHCGHLPHR
jgi:hypothetical protein